jgi:hypothetical protein
VSTSSQGRVLAAAVLVLALARCSASGTDCLRYSDCGPGLTCAAGKCVVPPPPADAALFVEPDASDIVTQPVEASSLDSPDGDAFADTDADDVFLEAGDATAE